MADVEHFGQAFAEHIWAIFDKHLGVEQAEAEQAAKPAASSSSSSDFDYSIMAQASLLQAYFDSKAKADVQA